jgi:hypothetical protein
VIRLMLAFLALLAAQPAFAQPDDWSYRGRRDGVHLRILRDYELPAGATSFEPIVVIGGSATINGRTEDDVVVIGGTVRLGPTAVVRGDVVAIGGDALIDPAAQISGRVDETIVMGPNIDFGIGRFTEGWSAAFAFGATILRLAIILIVSMVLTVVMPGWINAIARRTASSALASAGIGVAGQVLFVPALVAITIALVISVIGILLLPGLPVVMGAAALLWIAGFTAVAISVGSRLRGYDTGTSGTPLLDLLIGFVLISAVTLIAHAMALGPVPGPAVWAVRAAGWLIEWMVWTVGLGAALAALLGGRQPVTPPPMPFASPAPTTS